MPKCTKCNREINSLDSTRTGTLYYNVSLDKQGDLQYIQVDFGYNDAVDINEYLCPECNEVLFTSELEAIAFLKGV